jgi:multidrug efflux system membrane fusion protein
MAPESRTSRLALRGAQGVAWLVVCCLLLGATGCKQKGSRAQVAPAETAPIVVSYPAYEKVTDFVDFTGRTDAVHSVNIVARVTGYLVSPTKDGKMPFKEGSYVKKGALLFEIDPRPYEAQYDLAKSQSKLYEAQLELARSTLKRYEELNKTTPGAVSLQALDQYKAAVVEADARVNTQKENLRIAKLNLDFTQVTSPIDGQVSRYYLTLGNLVNQDQTPLTTVVSLDPMYAYFDVDERTLQQIKKAINEGRITSFGEHEETEVLLGLPGEEGFPHKGKINFLNNQVNAATGSLTMRGIFDNPVSKRGVRLLAPGNFVRIRLNIGEPHMAYLVIDRSVQSDQGVKYVYVVDADNKVQKRKVVTGALQVNGRRVVSEGLDKNDRVVTGALQQVREGMEVKPELRPMPSFGPQETDRGNSADRGNRDSKPK